MRFCKIQFGSDEFRMECELRQDVLRAPLGLDLCMENLDAEKHQLHFGLFDDNGKLVACVIAVVISPTQVKIRQMAVASGKHGNGWGRKLLMNVESDIAARGIQTVTLRARKNVAGFYERLGYMRYGGTDFIEVGIPHVAMHKRLA